MMNDILDAHADYVTILADGRNHTARAEERPQYQNHLAEAAILFSLIHQGASRPTLEEKLIQEQRAFGTSYLSGPDETNSN